MVKLIQKEPSKQNPVRKKNVEDTIMRCVCIFIKIIILPKNQPFCKKRGLHYSFS
ncbi:hypothetical protein OBV_29210 [Oscillibacter valericigenes Sjm18-20]|nr:hypothetical protein OBV_29210 [Oscillibacter valericigenes Sjm18-20]